MTSSAHIRRTSAGLPTQFRPVTPKYSTPLQGPGYHAQTRGTEQGLPEPPAMNERPFMGHKDSWRSSHGFGTWNSDNSPVNGSRNTFRRVGLERDWSHMESRVDKIFGMRSDTRYYFNNQAPPLAKTNPAAAAGARVLSSKWTAFELADGGLLYTHPTQREVLEWTQEQLRADAKENGRDVDAEVTKKIDEVLQHDPVQPYFWMKDQRLWLFEDLRRDTIRQEMRIRRLRSERGLPVPPVMLKHYDHEYPTDPDGAPGTPYRFKWYWANNWYAAPRFGTVKGVWPDDMRARMRKRQRKYAEELERQGLKVPQYRDMLTPQFYSADGEGLNGKPFDHARARAIRRYGGDAPAEAEVVGAS